jgi:hypothetical protein
VELYLHSLISLQGVVPTQHRIKREKTNEGPYYYQYLNIAAMLRYPTLTLLYLIFNNPALHIPSKLCADDVK